MRSFKRHYFRDLSKFKGGGRGNDKETVNLKRTFLKLVIIVERQEYFGRKRTVSKA